MATNEALRKDALRLVNLGVTQKTVAEKMGISEATLSRWLRGGGSAITVDAMDGLRRYIDELLTALMETKRQPAAEQDPDQLIASAEDPDVAKVFRAGLSRKRSKLPHHQSRKRAGR